MEEIQPHPPAVMSIQQVAAFLGVSRQHVYKLIHNGGLPIVSLGRRVVVLRTSLEEWLLTQQKTIKDL
ncbi:MAG TPA: helix-turn-helix domain-containing protein [Ktedonobacteraceae bacterium]|jgi:excisionase family DNA binding protein|nr:helix-turn-helix domain-containing protein [Ktedonobacteraceae bacterium]